MLNRTRQLWSQLNQRNKPNESEIGDAIAAGHQFKKLLETPAWKRINAWITRQDQGMQQFMEQETQVVSIWGVVKSINLFIKYLMMLHEHRAYKKLKTFLEVSIKKGEEYARQKAEFEKRRKGKTA